MNLQQVNNFEEPIFENYISEVNRILASEIFFRIDLTNEEFWNEFLKYVFKNITTKNFTQESLKIEKIIQIKNDKGITKSYLITKFEWLKELELSTFEKNKLIKINVRTKNVKNYKICDVWYLESKRSNDNIDKKEHKKLQNEFNARTVNKVLLLKEYLINRVRDFK